MITMHTRHGGRCLALTLAFALTGLPVSKAAAAPAPTAAHGPAAPATAPEPTAAHEPATPTTVQEPAADPDAATTPDSPASRNPVAEAAYAKAAELMRQGKHEDAIAELDLAAELEPTWSEPVRLRADAFAALAERYEPSAAFTSAHVAELERLLVLEPGVDTAARQSRIAALEQQAAEADVLEQRRRRLRTPALFVVTAAAGLFIAGVLLYSMKPREFLEPTAYRRERRDQAGIVLMTVGGVLIPPAIAIAVLSGRQSQRDAAVRDLEIRTGRPRARLGIGPQFVRGGGGLGLSLRF